MATVLSLGDPSNNPLEALEIIVKTSKCTALAHPKPWKRFAPRNGKHADEMDVDSVRLKDGDGGGDKTVWTQLKMRTEFHVERDEDNDDEKNEDNMDAEDAERSGAKVEKEQLIRGFKYGSSYVPCADGQFEKLSSHKGISICGFFNADNVCPDLSTHPQIRWPSAVSAGALNRGSTLCVGGS